MTRTRLETWITIALVSVGIVASAVVVSTVLPAFSESLRASRIDANADAIRALVDAEIRPVMSPTRWRQLTASVADATGGQVRVLSEGPRVHEVARSGGCCSRMSTFPDQRRFARISTVINGEGDRVELFLPAQADGRRHLVQVALAIPTGELARALVTRRLLIASVLVFSVSACLGFLLARVVGDRTNRVTDTAMRLAEGDLGARAPVQAPQQIAALGESLNRMAARLEAQIAEIQEQRDRAALLVTSIGDGVICVERNGVVRFVNPAAMRALGPTAARPTVVDDLPEPLRALHRDELPREPFGPDGVALADGRLYSVGVDRLPSPDDASVIVLRDITAERRLDRARRDLIANVSHELKTPVAAVKGFLEIHDDPAFDDAERREFREMMGAEVTRIERLIHDQLDLARIDCDAMVLSRSRHDVVEIARDLCDSREPIAAASGVRLVLGMASGPAPAFVDRNRIEQIVLVLLDNALRHTPAGGQVTVNVDTTVDHVRVTVSDEGPGIAPEDRPYIFDRFYRGDPSRQGPGTGLGLAIARGLAHVHGGSLDVSDTVPGHGATFILLLPRPRVDVSVRAA